MLPWQLHVRSRSSPNVKTRQVQRDIDILAPMAAKRQATVALSITTLDRSLARRMEPRAATPERWTCGLESRDG
jgi:DNA repair photolyase